MPVNVVTDATFDTQVLQAPTLTVVDFYTDWCGPCKVLSPTLEELADEYGETVRFVKLNAEDSPESAKRYDVTGYPTVVMVRDGEEVGRFSGAWPRREVRRQVDACLGHVAPEPNPAHLDTPPVAVALVEALMCLSTEDWAGIQKQLDVAAHLPATKPESTPESDQLSVLVSKVGNEVDELAAARFGDGPVAQAVTAAAVAAFVGWLDAAGPPLSHGQRVAAAPIAAHIGAECPADRALAPDVFLGALGTFTDQQWTEVGSQVGRAAATAAAVNELGKDSGHMLECWRAWFAAATLAKVLATRDSLDAGLYEAAWVPFRDVLDRDALERA